MVPFPLLNVKSCYSFMDSALTLPALVGAAVERGVTALALTDPNLHAAYDFQKMAGDAGITPVTAAALRLKSRHLNAYVRDGEGYENLCRLLSLGTDGMVTQEALERYGEGLILVCPQDPGCALPEVRYLDESQRVNFEVLQSIRTLTLLHERHPGKRRGAFAMPQEEEWRERWRAADRQAAADIVAQCRFWFDNTLRFPSFAPPDGLLPAQYLRELAEGGLTARYGAGAAQHRAQLHEELSIIHQVGYEEYFLAVHELLQECARQGIEWITRGSAADSLVCYALGISGVCPIRFDLYFKRFLNLDRMALQKLPDIDIDFAHDEKDRVVQILLDRYGSEHSAIVGGFNTFQARAAVAEVAKVLGVADHDIRRLTRRFPGYMRAADSSEAAALGEEAGDFPIHEEPYRTAVRTARFLDGFPRYPKMHPCGVVVSRDPIRTLTPTFVSNKGWPTTHFDMDAVENVGLIKLDILAQGGLAVIRDACRLLARRGVQVRWGVEGVPPSGNGGLHPAPLGDVWNDGAVWEMIASGRSRGVHHIESPAMINLARMAGVRDMDRLIAIVSVIRPGAANNLKKESFARRSQGMEPVTVLHPSLEPLLRSTFGVVAYEEHILQICEAFAGMNPGRADILRRALVKRNREKIAELREEFDGCARALGRTEADIAAVGDLVAGFEGYAFCRAHSTAYGVEAFQGAWLKCHHPAEFLAAVLSNGKGFYTRLAYTIECRRLGVTIEIFIRPDATVPWAAMNRDSAESREVETPSGPSWTPPPALETGLP